ncbi:MAG: YihY/virulence factor BrkB family protein [Endomicrobiales bacterium]
MAVRTWIQLAKGIISDWESDNTSLLAAALSYYTLFSLAPLLLVAVAVAGLIFGPAAAQENVLTQITGLVGPEGARMVEQLMRNTRETSTNALAAIAGGVLLAIGASSVFLALRNALNIIWKTPPKSGGGLEGFVRNYVFSFGIVVSTGFLLLVSLLASALLAGLESVLGLRAAGLGALWKAADILISWSIITALFALIFKVLPNVAITWRDVWTGAAVTAFLFTIGKFLIGLYLGISAVSSVYGAAGALVIILLWVYYSSQILFFGAEFTKNYSRFFGSLREGAGKDGQGRDA